MIIPEGAYGISWTFSLAGSRWLYQIEWGTGLRALVQTCAREGALVSLGTEAREIAYDGLNWLWNETSQQIYNFQNALKYAWYRGR
ncbi:MAG: hypothetical protein ABJF04_21565 [Reichenbachiella sp.]|uniref:hypothetical protein n=1 Tax=Reichenbachiella sp. TaxID=2184521 RepID=UPI0032646DF3